MPGLVIGGRQVNVPGVVIHNFLDDPKLKLADYDGRARRTTWVRNIMLHVTVGNGQQVLPGVGPSERWWERYPDIWASDKTQATKDASGNVIPGKPLIHGAHGVIDMDCVVGWYADALTRATFHCGTNNNEYSVGIELKQGKSGEVYRAQLDAAAKVVRTLCEELGIQWQIHWPYLGGPVARITDGRNAVGVFGHRDADKNRGVGDPGTAVMYAMLDAKCEKYDVSTDEDRTAWKKRQSDLNTQLGTSLVVDGIPGPATCAALKQAGYPAGLWVR